MTVEFTIPGPAVGKGRARATTINGHAHVYPHGKTMAYEGLVAHAACIAMNGRPLFEGPLIMTVAIACQVPASWSQRKQQNALAGLIRPCTKPDVTNVLKAIEDGMNGVVYRDDVQIVAGSFAKFYAATPCVKVRLERVDLDSNSPYGSMDDTRWPWRSVISEAAA